MATKKYYLVIPHGGWYLLWNKNKGDATTTGIQYVVDSLLRANDQSSWLPLIQRQCFCSLDAAEKSIDEADEAEASVLSMDAVMAKCREYRDDPTYTFNAVEDITKYERLSSRKFSQEEIEDLNHNYKVREILPLHRFDY